MLSPPYPLELCQFFIIKMNQRGLHPYLGIDSFFYILLFKMNEEPERHRILNVKF